MKPRTLLFVGAVGLGIAAVWSEKSSIKTGEADIDQAPTPTTMVADAAPSAITNSAPARNFTIV